MVEISFSPALSSGIFGNKSRKHRLFKFRPLMTEKTDKNKYTNNKKNSGFGLTGHNSYYPRHNIYNDSDINRPLLPKPDNKT
jgi:hypothetical protein